MGDEPFRWKVRSCGLAVLKLVGHGLIMKMPDS